MALFMAFALAAAGCAGRSDSESRLESAGEQSGNAFPGGKSTSDGFALQSQVQATPRPFTGSAPAQGFERQAADKAQSVEVSDLAVAAALQAAQSRIIVRTVDLEVTVLDVASTFQQVGALARRYGGWVVSTDRSEKHRGHMALRVPAERLDEALAEIRGFAVDVEAEVSTSKDVTDEFVDLSSSLRNLQATELALLRLFERADKVEDALKVQTELTKVQGEIEKVQGRLTFLEQTSAFSLVNLTAMLEPGDLPVDAGPDRRMSVGQPATFTAKLRPPEGVDRFRITWNFGDGSPSVTTDRTAPTLEDGVLVTAGVGHVFFDDTASPYIVEVKITGTGDAGTFEGKDTVIVTVSRLPVVLVFAGNDRDVEEGEKVDFRASFTRPEGVDGLGYSWDFGDGSRLVSGELAAGVTEISVSHVYRHHRPESFEATLKLTGQSAAGKVETSDSLRVFVRESPGWVAGGWELGSTARGATRALSQAAQVGLYIGIWAAILSPVLLAGGIVVLLVAMRIRRRRTSGAA